MPSKHWEQQRHPAHSRHRLSGVKTPESHAGLWCKQVPCLCLRTNANPCLLVFQGQENAFVKDFVSAAEVRKEIAHLFINTNELVVFKNKILKIQFQE